MIDPMHHELRACRIWGFALLLLAALGGSVLELLHALKASAYLHDEMSRLLLTLAHAHAGAMGLLLLVFASHGNELFEKRHVGRMLRLGAVCLPLGFVMGVIAHPESDPGIGILLAPFGALLVILALTASLVTAIRR